MQIIDTEFILSTLFFILIIITIITIINYNHSTNHLLPLYIDAQKDNINNKEEKSDKNKKNILKKEQEQTKEDSDKDKTKENSKKKDNSEFYKIDPAYRSFFPIQRIVIPEVYQTVPNGEAYRFNITNPNDHIQVDERENEEIFTKQNDDGSWRIDYGRPRVDVHTKDAGIIPDKKILEENMSKSIIQSWNYSELKEIGYWYKPSDWKNVEVTLIFKLLDSARSKGEQHALSIVTRSISHSEIYDDKKDKDKPAFYCGGSSYHNNISNDGNVRMKKEQFHIDYEWERYNPDKNVGIEKIYDKIIGFKGIVYNINNTAVKLETWVDTENQGKGPYKKVHELIDNGDWGDNMKVCGAKRDGQAITWGSPTVIIKANDFKFDIYDLEIREIIPPQSK
jgi:hypothetical protein